MSDSQAATQAQQTAANPPPSLSGETAFITALLAGGASALGLPPELIQLLGFLGDASIAGGATQVANEQFAALLGDASEVRHELEGAFQPLISDERISTIRGVNPGQTQLDVLQSGLSGLEGISFAGDDLFERQRGFEQQAQDVLGRTAGQVGGTFGNTQAETQRILGGARLDPLQLGTDILSGLNLPTFSPTRELEQVGQANVKFQSLLGQQLGANEDLQAQRLGLENQANQNFALQGLTAADNARARNFQTEQFKGGLLERTGVAAQGINAGLAQTGAGITGELGAGLAGTQQQLGLASAGLRADLGEQLFRTEGFQADVDKFNVLFKAEKATQLAEAAKEAALDPLLVESFLIDLERADNTDRINAVITAFNAELAAAGQAPVPLLSSPSGHINSIVQQKLAQQEASSQQEGGGFF